MALAVPIYTGDDYCGIPRGLLENMTKMEVIGYLADRKAELDALAAWNASRPEPHLFRPVHLDDRSPVRSLDEFNWRVKTKEPWNGR